MRSSFEFVRLAASAGVSIARRARFLSCLWEVTYRCNARCSMCNYWRTSTGDNELSVTQIQNGLRRIHAYGCRLVHFTGGEPTLRKDLEEVVAASSGLGMWTSLVTNGSTLTRHRLAELKHSGLDHLLVSLDSTDASRHDHTRGVPGLFERVRTLLHWLAADFLTGHRSGGIMCVLTTDNVHQISELVKLAEDIGVYIVFQPYHWNKTGERGRCPVLNPEAETQLLDLRRDGSALISSSAYLSGVVRYCNGLPMPSCNAARKYFSVDPYGYVHPCVDTPQVGHVLRDDLDVLHSDNAARLVAQCQGCWYCFRGEPDTSLTLRGTLEKLAIMWRVVAQNSRRARNSAN